MTKIPSVRLLLVDALSVAYRAFYAIPPLSTSCRIPTNAVLGFVKTIQQARKLWQPSHALVAFDGGRDVRKTALLPEYKAQRPPMPEEFRIQLPELDAYLDAARISRLRMDAREADDVIASAAAMAQKANAEVLILSSDKDLFQSVDEHIRIIQPSKADVMLGENEVLAKLGVLPKQVPDFLALVGDASDNIPGVQGVGPKTAAKWLAAYGSLDGIKQHLNVVTPERFREILRQAWPNVERNLQLARLDKSMTLPLDLEKMVLPQVDSSQMISFFQRLEFHAMLKDLTQPCLFGPV